MNSPQLKEKWQAWQEQVQALWQRLLAYEYSGRDLALLFLLALAIGLGIKSSLNDWLTIGFDDYRLSRAHNLTDLNLLERQLLEQGESLAAEKEPRLVGDSCQPTP